MEVARCPWRMLARPTALGRVGGGIVLDGAPLFRGAERLESSAAVLS